MVNKTRNAWGLVEFSHNKDGRGKGLMQAQSEPVHSVV